MTQTFWTAATVLILIALAFVLYPVFFYRPKARREADLQNQNLLAYKTRLKELDDEHQAGILDEQSYHQLKDELAGAMIDDVSDEGQPRTRTAGRRSAMVIALASILLIPAGAYFGYQKWGAMERVEQFITMQEMGSTGQTAQMITLADQLRDRLEQDPDNIDGWAMLGQTYMQVERYEDAAYAFQRLASATKENPDASSVAWGLSAQALYFASEGELTPEVMKAIDSARALDPDEINALGLLGINAFSQQNYREAIGYWEQIIEVTPGHPQISAIQGGIDEAYKRLGEDAPAKAAPEAPAPSSGVDVRISLDEGFRGQVPGDTTLFVFARPLNTAGGPPVAVARMTAAALPLEIRLDDRYAMTPEATISSVGEVQIVARLSRSGSINPQAGDWQGQVEATVLPPEADGEPVQLVIATELTN
ncbi:MAG TPA: c-type cytochrome biogenesis protein CcmI [Marinobacter sp.]|nr:c-type cytochrome biogenesis protein CcmI [Marinobacter sp.]